MCSLDRQVRDLGRRIESTHSEELKKDYRKTQRQRRADLKKLEGDADVSFQELRRTQLKARRTQSRPSTSSSKPTCAS
jgi:RNA polymerase primary sigma factor